MPHRPLALQTEHLDSACSDWLAERCELSKCGPDEPGFGALLEGAEALVIRTYTKVDRALLEKAPRLRVVGRAGVGLDNVDLAACAARGVVVVNTPDANSSAVVEYVFALLADATRPRVFLQKAVEPARWRELRQELKAARQLCELTLGVYGFGRVGSRVARVARALDMRVIYNDLREIPPEARHGAEPVTPEVLAAQADVISVHVDGRRRNQGLIGPDFIGRMQSHVLLVNTSRGFVLNNHALADFMIAHPGAAAMLDVHEPEPFGDTYPLLDIPNVHLSPHIASATTLANEKMSWVVRDVWRVLSGEPPEFPAAPEPA